MSRKNMEMTYVLSLAMPTLRNLLNNVCTGWAEKHTVLSLLLPFVMKIVMEIGESKINAHCGPERNGTLLLSFREFKRFI